jgi:hypothetical protein
MGARNRPPKPTPTCAAPTRPPLMNPFAAHRWLLVLAVALVVATPRWSRAVSYNENIFGDLSSDPSAPDIYELAHGFNILTGTFGDGDIDVIRLHVPMWHELRGIKLLNYSGATQSFAGIQASGAQWTAGTLGAVNPNLLMGWTHFGPAANGAAVGQDILDNMAIPNSGSTGLAIPLLGPNDYPMLLQDTGSLVSYQIQFDIVYNVRKYGDFNDDFLVKGNDLTKWMTEFGVNAGSDSDADGDSDGADFLTWQRNLNRNFSYTATATPEPSAAVLAAAACALLASSRRNRQHP